MKQKELHVWETNEITLIAREEYDNPYTDVTVWVDLKGPEFDKRVYGFWDGNNIFKVRVTATKPGIWTYVSGASVNDLGLCGVNGGFLAVDWSEEEKKENPTRRGIVQATENGHAFQYPDGTPYIMVGDTWWGLATYRYPWVEDDIERPIGPDMSMKDMIRHRRKQGFNTVGMIAAFPTWANDGKPAWIQLKDENNTCLRNAWTTDGSAMVGSRGTVAPAKDMHNEGGRAFNFPGKIKGYENVVPDFDRINPEYFKVLDKKIDYLNANGFTVFIEVMRRDCSKVFKHYYNWPMAYTRYIQYIFSRYQTNNCLFSPIHFDCKINTLDAREFNEPINLYIDIYGQPPFGTLLGTNSSPSTLINYGGPEEQHWLTFHQLANWREHDYYWLLTDAFHAQPTCPSINGEPYYSGHIETTMESKDENGNMIPQSGVDADSMDDNLNCRSGYYGSVLSGALGGILAGYEGGWGAAVEEESIYKIWDTMNFKASYEVQYFCKFLLTEGIRYRDLIPNAELVTPNKTGKAISFRGWAFCAATKERDLLLGYAEKDCPKLSARALRPADIYEFTWFNPRTGEWLEDQTQQLEVKFTGEMKLPEYPDELDWAFKLKKVNKDLRINTNEDELGILLNGYYDTFLENFKN